MGTRFPAGLKNDPQSVMSARTPDRDLVATPWQAQAPMKEAWETQQPLLLQSLDLPRDRHVLRLSPRRPSPNDPLRSSRSTMPGFVALPSPTGSQLNASLLVSSAKAIRPKSAMATRPTHPGSYGSGSIRRRSHSSGKNSPQGYRLEASLVFVSQPCSSCQSRYGARLVLGERCPFISPATERQLLHRALQLLPHLAR
jgi:hypothetical protein